MDEPNTLMRWVMFHFAGGDAFYLGFLGLLLLSMWPEAPQSVSRWSLVALICMIWSGLSAPAIPLKILIPLMLVILAWRISVHWHGPGSPMSDGLKWCVWLVVTGSVYLEFNSTHYRTSVGPPEKLAVIADSITAGLNDGEVTWPQLLARRTGLPIRDASQPGATLKSALRQADDLHDDATPLLLEIGGNDLLGGRLLKDFTQDFKALCEKVCRPGRIVWMCELPLPPGKSQFGVAQRQLCHRYGIRLLPKRRMMAILTTAGATVDGIHLSAAGQQQFSEFIQHSLGCQTAENPHSISYEKVEQQFPAH